MSDDTRALRAAQLSVIVQQAMRIAHLEKLVEAQAEAIRRLETPKPSEQARKEAQA